MSTGSLDDARRFRDERQVRFPILVDPRMRAFRAAGLRRGVTATVNLKTISNALRAAKAGDHQGRTQGDPWQLGGAFVIRPGGLVVYEQRSDVAGDHADPEAILAALGGAPVSA